jgi:hypothetical protein
MKKLSLSSRRLVPLLMLPAVLAMLLVSASFNSDSGGTAAAAPKESSKAKKALVIFNEDGELLKPTGYRKWTYVGTPVTPNDMNEGNAPFPEFHSVYMNPDAYDHYEKTGDFPDGTVLIKELISVGDKEATSGEGYFMGDFSGLEVAIKDKARFRDEPANWAYFSFGHKYPLKEKAKIQPVVSCNECHDGSADDDWVFTQYYPVLRAAKGSAKSE